MAIAVTLHPPSPKLPPFAKATGGRRRVTYPPVGRIIKKNGAVVGPPPRRRAAKYFPVCEKVGYSAAVEEGRQAAGLYPPPVKPSHSWRFPIVVDDRLKSSGRP